MHTFSTVHYQAAFTSSVPFHALPAEPGLQVPRAYDEQCRNTWQVWGMREMHARVLQQELRMR